MELDMNNVNNYHDELINEINRLQDVNKDMLEALIEVNDFLSHIQPKVGQFAFDTIDEIVNNAINKATK